MPKSKSPKLTIHLDLLKPQSNPEQLVTKLLRWLLSTGRFIFVFVEALVLIVFIARFKLDEDLVSNKDAIDQKIQYVESLKYLEVLTRNTQLKLATISTYNKKSADYPKILQNIALQTPAGVKLASIKMEKTGNDVILAISGTSTSNNDLATFVAGLKQDPLFADVNINSVGIDKETINFNIKSQVKT